MRDITLDTRLLRIAWRHEAKIVRRLYAISSGFADGRRERSFHALEELKRELEVLDKELAAELASDASRRR